jgi:hypothetical protein
MSRRRARLQAGLFVVSGFLGLAIVGNVRGADLPPALSGDFTFAYQVCVPDNPANCVNVWLDKASVHPAQGPVVDYYNGTPDPVPSAFFEYESAATYKAGEAPAHAPAGAIRTAVDCATGTTYWWRSPATSFHDESWSATGPRHAIRKEPPYINLLKMICGS